MTAQSFALTPREKQHPMFVPKFFPLEVVVRFQSVATGNTSLRPYGQQLLRFFCLCWNTRCRRTLGSEGRSRVSLAWSSLVAGFFSQEYFRRSLVAGVFSRELGLVQSCRNATNAQDEL